MTNTEEMMNMKKEENEMNRMMHSKKEPMNELMTKMPKGKEVMHKTDEMMNKTGDMHKQKMEKGHNMMGDKK